MVAWLSTAGWSFFLGHCHGDVSLARAVSQVVLLATPIGDAAKANRIPKSTLHRQSQVARELLGQLIRRGDLHISDLVSIEHQEDN